LIEVFDQY